MAAMQGVHHVLRLVYRMPTPGELKDKPTL